MRRMFTKDKSLIYENNLFWDMLKMLHDKLKKISATTEIDLADQTLKKNLVMDMLNF